MEETRTGGAQVEEPPVPAESGAQIDGLPALYADEVQIEAPGTMEDALHPRPRGRRLIRIGLLAVATGIVAGGLFTGGWFAHDAYESHPAAPSDKLAEALLPKEGVALNVRLGDLPARLAREGVIDVEKFKTLAQGTGKVLTPAQLALLSNGSNETLRIDADNAGFVLNLLWAIGLANKSPVLTVGPIGQLGWEKSGSYASTGGWTLGANPGGSYLATLELITLTPEQEAVVEEVALASYRPCCGNMTAFPDCNHGMAALGLIELMAAQGATANEIFAALKKVSPFWFPTQYHQLGLYFEHQGQKWDVVDPRVVMGKDYSSAAGWNQVNSYLQQHGVFGDGSGGAKGGSCAP